MMINNLKSYPTFLSLQFKLTTYALLNQTLFVRDLTSKIKYVSLLQFFFFTYFSRTFHSFSTLKWNISIKINFLLFIHLLRSFVRDLMNKIKYEFISIFSLDLNQLQIFCAFFLILSRVFIGLVWYRPVYSF
jgi:hypothetical protein